VITCHSLDFITNKVEEALGVDLNKDGRIGGPGPMAEVERATHIDMNHDGVIGGYRPTPGGGKTQPSAQLTLFSSSQRVLQGFVIIQARVVSVRNANIGSLAMNTSVSSRTCRSNRKCNTY
jgi:hypothetical protein